MNIKGIVINTRTRNPWQAINLGVIITRAWYWPLFFSWLIPSATVALIAALVFPNLVSWLPITLVWWLKPFWDRGPLFIASRRLFNEPTGLIETLKALPRLYAKDFLMWMTLRRLSTTRSFDMPVNCLEGLVGSARRSRLAILHREGSSESTLTLLLLVHLELLLVIAFISLVYLFIPQKFTGDVFQFFKHQLSLDLLIYNVLYFFAMAAIAPFYSVCGFSQYINRRIGLEGWGIELQFRQLVKNHSAISSTISPLLTLIFVGVCLFSSPTTVYAQSPAPPDVSSDQTVQAKTEAPEQLAEELAKQLEIKATVKGILSGEVFHQMRQKSNFRFKDAKTLKDGDVPQWMISFIEFLERNDTTFTSMGEIFKSISTFFGSLAGAVEVIMWCLLVAFIIWVIYLYREFFKRVFNIKSKSQMQPHDEPEQLFGLDVRGSSLPERPLDVVKKLWESHEHREAISLLYRATLVHLINERRMPFRSGFTEYDCFTSVKNAYPNTPLTNYFGKLSNAWEMIAYAHRVPDEASVELLLAQWAEIIEHGE